MIRFGKYELLKLSRKTVMYNSKVCDLKAIYLWGTGGGGDIVERISGPLSISIRNINHLYQIVRCRIWAGYSSMEL